MRLPIRYKPIACVVSLLALLGIAGVAHAQTRDVNIAQWDIFFWTGNNPDATQNISAITRDTSDPAGPAGGWIWIAGQSPAARLGRLDPTASVNNYKEWRVFETGETFLSTGSSLGLAATSTGDVWMAVKNGRPSFLLKGAGTDRFRRFMFGTAADYQIQPPLEPEGIAVASGGSLVVALQQRESAPVGQRIGQIPRDLSTASSVIMKTWLLEGGAIPRYVAVDASGKVWFTDEAKNTVARLDLGATTNNLTEWRLPFGSNPSGLQVTLSTSGGFPDARHATVCVASGEEYGGAGEIQCLNTATNPATVTRVTPSVGGPFNLPRNIARNAFGDLFVTEQNTNSVIFLDRAATIVGAPTLVSKTTSTVGTQDVTLYADTATIGGTTYSVPTGATAPEAEPVVTDIGPGQLRITPPPAALTYPEAHDGPRQPVGITSVIDDGSAGGGTVFVADYFAGPLVGRFWGGRVERLEVVPPNVLTATPASLQFEATVDTPAPSAQQLAISIVGAPPSSWSVISKPDWVTITPDSGTTPTTVDVTVDHAYPNRLMPGEYSGAIVIDDGADGATPRAIPVTLNVRGLDAAGPMIGLQGTLSFTTMRGVNAGSQPMIVSNSGLGPLTFQASGVMLDAPGATVQIMPATGTVGPDGDTQVQVSVSSASLAPGTYWGLVTVVSTGTPAEPQTLPITLTVNPAPRLITTPAQLAFDVTRWTVCNGTTSGSNPPSQTLVLTNTTNSPMWFLARPSTATGGPWLSVTPVAHVVLPGQSRTLDVSVDPRGLGPGTLAGTITLHVLTHPQQNPHGLTTEKEVVPVTLNVNPAPARLCVSPTALDFGTLKQTTQSAPKTISIRNIGDGDLEWSATASASNGTVSLTRIQTGLRVSIITGTKKGPQSGKVVITTSGGTSQTVTLKWQVTDKKGGGHHDDDDDDDDHRRHRRGDRD